MSEKIKGIEKLEDSEVVEMDPIVEEQTNANMNYHYLDEKFNYAKQNLPYKDTNLYSTGIDYEDIDNVQYQKRRNKKWEDEINKWKKYCKDGSLFIGHVQVNDTDYFITENIHLDSTDLCERNDLYLINSESEKYAQIVNDWRFPRKDNHVELARNINMKRRHVDNVDVLLDARFQDYAEISDKYLRSALLRNKHNPVAQSIIQTIQEKQNDIRELPANNSFIVQGCAGSGKTMVLLHRLRYQIYNEEIYNSQFLFLVPSYKFKAFIEDLLNKFNISAKNVMPYTEYYQRVSGIEIDYSEEDVSELVFNNDYLARVYSESFMKECYQELFMSLNKKLSELVSYCDLKLNNFIKRDIEDNNRKMDELTASTFELIDEIVAEFKPYFNSFEEYTAESLGEYIRVIRTNLKKLTDGNISEKESIKKEIEDDDPRILENFKLAKLRDEILQEEDFIKNGSILTVEAHKKKLDFLKDKFSKLKKTVIKHLNNSEKTESDHISYVQNKFNGIYEKYSANDIQNIINTVNELSSEYSKEMSVYKRKKKDYENNDFKKYNRYIKLLNDVIEETINLEISMEGYYEGLIPGNELLYKNYLVGADLFKKFKKLYDIDNLDFENLSQEEWSRLNAAHQFMDQFKFFDSKSKSYIEMWSQKKLFLICSQKVFEEFQIKICEFYKHYWYLNAYSSYLTKSYDGDKYPFIFIDESQDLSVSEIELINKFNLVKVKNGKGETFQRAVMNLFGDVNQTITKHGIIDWKDVKNISKVYFLDENFRNTRQIVKYCNSNLSMNMTDIGVDMENVSRFSTLENAIISSKNILDKAVFIVKDEYATQDLKKLISSSRVKNPTIYTVKDVKGLEFQEIYVFNRGMTRNEMYIAYTRALAKLNIIFQLPLFKKEQVNLVVQGDDINEDIYAELDALFKEESEEEIPLEKDINEEKIIENNVVGSISEEDPYEINDVSEDIRKQLDILFEKLNKYYPNRIVDDSNKMDMRTLKSILNISKALKYRNAAAFLKAYGYEMIEN